MKQIRLAASLVALAGAAPVYAVTLSSSDQGETSLDINSSVGVYSTSQDYLGEGGKQWQEGFLQGTLKRTQSLGSGNLYGGIGLISSLTRGDGDAGGYSTGDESRTSLDSAYLGWKSSDETLDVSVGKQMFQLGDGFLIAGDALNLGDGLDKAYGTDVDRGGAYYLAPRKTFANSAIVRFAATDSLKTTGFWLQSDNPYQQDTRLAGADLEWTTPLGAVGTSLIRILGVDAGSGLGLWDQRDGMNIVSLRGQGNAGVENLALSAEFVRENGGNSDVKNNASAWYLEAGWTFADLPWTPTLNGRYATFSGDDADTSTNEAFDPLFFGFTRGYGTWFQGEVAANYAGPANSGNNVKRLELSAAPSESWVVGIQHWNFDSIADSADLAGRELDLYGLWTVNDHLMISPVLGFYTPTGSDVIANQGNNHTNVYGQALVMLFY